MLSTARSSIDLYRLIAYHCPDLLDFLLPSDAIRLASTCNDFRIFFLGGNYTAAHNSKTKNETDQTFPLCNVQNGSENQWDHNYIRSKHCNMRNENSDHGFIDPQGCSCIGELWWRRRCLNYLAFSIVGVVHPVECRSWMGTYCGLRNLFQCRVALRLTRDLSLATPHSTSIHDDHMYEEWIILKNEELEEAGLERFFQQCDFYRHQLATVFVLTIRVTKLSTKVESSHRQWQNETVKGNVHTDSQSLLNRYSNQSGRFDLFVRQSFTEVPPEDTQPISPFTFSVSQSEHDLPSQQQRSALARAEGSTDIVPWYPATCRTSCFIENLQELSTSSLSSSESAKSQNGSKRERSSSPLNGNQPTEQASSFSESRSRRGSQESASLGNPSDTTAQSRRTRRRLQLRLPLPSRARLVEFHQFIVHYVTEHCFAWGLSLGPERLITPSELMLLCYRLTSSWDPVHRRHSWRYPSNLATFRNYEQSFPQSRSTVQSNLHSQQLNASHRIIAHDWHHYKTCSASAVSPSAYTYTKHYSWISERNALLNGLPAQLQSNLTPDLWQTLLLIFAEGVRVFYNREHQHHRDDKWKNSTSVACDTGSPTYINTIFLNRDRTDNSYNRQDVTSFHSDDAFNHSSLLMSRLQSLLTKTILEQEQQHPGYKVTKLCLTVTSQQLGTTAAEKKEKPVQESKIGDGDNMKSCDATATLQQALPLPIAYTQEVFNLLLYQ